MMNITLLTTQTYATCDKGLYINIGLIQGGHMSKVLGTVVLRESMGRVITAVQLCEHAYIPKCLHKRHIIIQTTSFKKAQAASVSHHTGKIPKG